MPKIKTHRGAAKRFNKTGSGKITRAKAFKQHILVNKSTKRLRGMRGTTLVSAVDTPRVEKMIPYK